MSSIASRPPPTTIPPWRKRLRETGVGYAFILPMLVLFVVFRIWPAVWSFLLSFQDYRLRGGSEWLGFENYQRLRDDDDFWQALKVTFIYAAIAVPLTTVLSLAMAVLVNQKLRAMSFFRALYFLPYITSLVMVGVIWKWIYHNPDGLLNSVLGTVSLGPISWLESDRLVLPSLAIMSAWKGLGYAMMILLAGLRSIDPNVLEAAAVDGATGWQRFFQVTLPLLKPVLFFVIVIETIGAFQVFDAIYVMTGGGPVRASYSLVYKLYDEGFRFLDFGYASAIGVVLFAMVMCVSLIQRAMFGKNDV
ncbi:MAG: carbohydrate ABC transporter permease [Thermomicrobiales bacterium]